MPITSVRTRRRVHTVVGMAAALGLLTAGPAMSAPQSAAPARASSVSASVSVPTDVTLFKTKTSLLGVHRWYRQVLDGYPVVGGMYAVHETTTGRHAGKVATWDGRVKVGTLAATDATVTADAAIAAAVAYTKGTPLTFVAPSLWALPGAQTRLVWSVSTVTSNPGGAHLSYVDAITGAVLKDEIESKTAEPEAKWVTGKAKVFDPNPVVKLQDEELTDQGDSDAAVPAKAYSKRKLRNLDKSHTLVGRWAKLVNSDLASSKSDKYFFTRSNDDFEQVMDYYALDTEQMYYQQLGFTDVNAEPQKIQADAMSDDNSWYIPAQDLIQTGTGGVDDAEDPEVVWHEAGHATQDDQVPGFGRGSQAGAIGEGYGDYIAVTLSQQFSEDTKLTPWTCVMDWDATSYTPPPTHCLRTTDTTKMYPDDLTGEVHADGEIWSAALWKMNLSMGRDKATTAIIEGTFNFDPATTMPDAAKKVVAAAKELYGKKMAKKATAAFHAKGIL
jgi:Zn-dependent metalloprotease